MRRTIELGTVMAAMLALVACEEQRTEERAPGAPAGAEQERELPPVERRAPQEQPGQQQPGQQPGMQGQPGQAQPGMQPRPGEAQPGMQQQGEEQPTQPMFEERENIEPPREQEPLEGAFDDPLDPGLEDEEVEQRQAQQQGQAQQSFAIPAVDFTTEDLKQQAQATLRDKNGNVMGTATFQVVPFGVAMTFEGQNLPAGTHGFHIHETGRCTPPDFESAGGHFNPTDSGHGFADPEDLFHLGDMPNLEVQADGSASMHYLLPGLNLKSGHEFSLLDPDGSALVLHTGRDDYASEPAGNSGARIGCGVVQAVTPDVG